MEQLEFNLLFRWFVGLGNDAPVWHPTVYTKNRDRLLTGDEAAALLAGVLRQANTRRLLSPEHFTAVGTQLQARASHKSFQPKTGAPRRPNDDDLGNPTVNLYGGRRSNASHVATTDPDSRLAKKGHGKEAKLSYQASVTLDTRHGLVVGTLVGPADGGYTEVEQATTLLTALHAQQPQRAGRRTIGGDEGYAKRPFLEAARGFGVTPHVAQTDTDRARVLDGRTTRHPGYAVSQQRRKRIEASFGWGKTIGMLRKLRHRGQAPVDGIFAFTMAAYNLVRLRTLVQAGVCPA